MCWSGRPEDRPGTDGSGHRECKNLEKHPRKPQRLQFRRAMKNLFACPCSLPDGSQRIALSLRKHMIWTKLIFSFYRWLPAVQHPRFANWLMFEIYGLTASFVQFHGLEEHASRTPHVLTWPLGAQSWLYILSSFFMPWKIFTQVSHNHSGTAVDTELHADGHTPAVGYIIFLQRCSGDTSVSSLAHQLIKFGWMKTAWLCSMKGLGIISIKSAACHLTFIRSPRLLHIRWTWTCAASFAASSVYCACVTSRASLFMPYIKRLASGFPPPHTQRSNTDLWLLRLPATIKGAGSSPT